MPARGPVGSSARPLLPPAPVASPFAAAVTPVMSERDDCDFKRKRKQEEQTRPLPDRRDAQMAGQCC